MNVNRATTFFGVLMLLALPALLGAWANYQTVSTDNFVVFFRDGWESEARNALQALEYSRPYVEKLTGNSPGQVAVVLSDMGNMVNGFANPTMNVIGLFATTPSSGELGMVEDWWQLVGTHEYIHMAQMTRNSGIPGLLRSVFGNVLYPNLFQPMWMTEGITVYGESQLSEFSGRLNDGSYPAIINSLARASRLPSRGKACFNSYGEPLANFYVYGASFHQYLAKTYGEDKFSRLYELNSSSIAAYLNPLFSTPGLERAFRLTYGKALEQLWQEWIQDATANSFPLPEMKLTSDGWVKKKLRTDSGSLYYIQRQSEKTGPASSFTSHSLSRLDPGSDSPPQVLIRQNSDFPAGYQITPDKIYFSRAEWQTGFDNNDFDGLGVITEVWEADLSGASRKKLFSGNIRAFCHLENELLLTAEDDLTHQGSEIYEVSTTTGAKRLLGHLDYLISGLQVHNGQIFVSARGFWKNNSIYLLDTFNFRLIPLIDTPYAETLVSVDAGGLIFNANYGGRNGSYHYDLDSKKLTRFSGCEEF